jgi:signal transduction histidine kinase
MASPTRVGCDRGDGDRLADLLQRVLRFTGRAEENTRSLVSLAGESLGGACAFYSRLQGDVLSSAERWQAPADCAPQVPAEGHIASDLLRRQVTEPAIVRDLLHSPYANTDPNIPRWGWQTYIGIPVTWGGKPVGVLAVVYCRDAQPDPADLQFLQMVAALVGAEADRERLQAQLMQSQKLETIGRLAGGVAHEFNNMLTVINGYSEMLLGQMPKDDRRRKCVEEIGKAGERAAMITRRLLAFNRRRATQPQVIEFNGFVAEMGKWLPRVLGPSIELRAALGAPSTLVQADPGQLEQVVLSLAINARDAMPEGGHLTMETEILQADAAWTARHPKMPPGAYVVLIVRDTGAGMDAETLSQLFEPLFTRKQMGQGDGLALAAVCGIVEQAGGHVLVESEPGKGTTFRVCLPRFTSAPAAGASPARR